MNYKTLFFILTCITVTNLKSEPLPQEPILTESNFNKLKNWITQDKKHALIAITCILGPLATTYGYFFGYEQILDLISNLSYKSANAIGQTTIKASDGFVDGLVDSATSNPALIAELAALGLLYKTIFTGLPFVLTSLVQFMLKVK
jgi:hypothetical protein